jgi:hypothetical protein
MISGGASAQQVEFDTARARRDQTVPSTCRAAVISQ